jgi:hypothetical protein
MRNVMQVVKRVVWRAICAKFGFTIHSDEFNHTHYTMDWKEALEWMRMYPCDDMVNVCYRGQRVAIRGV